MTLKTGNFKKFGIFLEMLFSAMEGASNTVALEVLTMKDLHKAGAVNAPSTHHEAEKLYLIITVHYPLPLMLRNEKSFDELHARLKDSESERLATVQELSLMMRENDRLKHLLKSSAGDALVLSSKEAKELQDQLVQVQLALQGSQQCGHHQVHATLASIVSVLATKLLPAAPPAVTKLSKPRSVSNGPVPPSKGKPRPVARSLSNSKPKPSPSLAPKRTNYTIVKSEPLDRRPLAKRGKQARRADAVATSSPRRPSSSPFQRFDPTLYVREREAKLEERRSRSRQASRSNVSSSQSISRERTPSNRSLPRSDRGKDTRKLELSKERPRAAKPDGHPLHDRRPVHLPRQSLLERSSPVQSPRPNADPDPDLIDQRLAQLQLFLQTALK
ncbi:Coiled-coil domain-containing protein 61 [Kappamyces sp. JEL0680]|nr:Coiled-coil domain-containing protein 61 [Kappamyces sp. JEL0680]